MEGLLLATAQEGASVGRDSRSGETLVWIFCRLENSVKDFVVISWPYSKGRVRVATGRLLVTDG